MDYFTLKYLHFLGIFGIVGGLFAQLWMVTSTLTREQIKVVAKIDGIYGVGSIVAVAAGLTLWLGEIGKSPEFYTSHGLIYWKLGILSVVGVLSIYPTLFFARNKTSKKNPQGDEVISIPKLIIWIIRIELLLIVPMPWIASRMAAGLSF